ncbi:Diacylglycerol kinase [Umbelopsis sp. WA50703]
MTKKRANGAQKPQTNGHAKRPSTSNGREDDRYAHIQPKGSWEIPRKVFHYSIGFFVLVLYTHGFEPSDIYPALLVLLVIVGSAEILRFTSKEFNSFYISVLGPMMRKTEISTRVNGVVYYLIGCITVLYCFPKDIGSLSIVYLSWADPTASIFGRLFGQYTPKFSNKSLAGSLGAAAIGGLVTYGFFNHMMAHGYSHPSFQPNTLLNLNQLSLYGGFVAAFSEAIGGVVNVDDNLTIPVLSAVLLWVPLVHFGYGN